MFYKNFLRPVLFRSDPEVAHERALHLAAKAGNCRVTGNMLSEFLVVSDAKLQQTLWGLTFPNPVGLAAGFDKNAVGVALWPSLGFGFVELGSVTARAQPGNDKPRLWRLVEQQAVINRMGFNNDGADVIAPRVPPPPHRIPIAVNIGKSKVTPLEQAADDYLHSIERFRDRSDFFVINVSSPNTPGLRKLQDRGMLDDLLGRIVGSGLTLPVLLKLAPDLTLDQMDDALLLAFKHGLAGIVATNTTIEHPTPPEGGLSGKPLRARATECVRHLYRQSEKRMLIIGVGGIFTAEDAYEKIRAGASLVEVWTGMIYKGPTIARSINRGLLRLLARDGHKHVGEAVGVDA